MDRRRRILLSVSYEIAGLAVLALLVWLSVLWVPLWFGRLSLSWSVMVGRVAGGFSSFFGGSAPASYLTPGFSLAAVGVAYGPGFEGFLSCFWAWGWSLISVLGSALWVGQILAFLRSAFQFTMVFAPLFLAGRLLFDSQLSYSGLLFGHESRPLLAWRSFEDRVLSPVFCWFWGFFLYWRRSGLFVFSFAYLLVVLSGLAVLLDFVGLYFWLLGAAEFVPVLDVAWALLLTFLYDVRYVPVFVWGLLAFWLKNRLAFKAADAEICRLWEIDRKTVRDNMGTFTLLVGLMRSGKDKLSVIVCTLLQEIFRQNALESMEGYRAMFSWFPWIWLERELDSLIRLEVDQPGRVVNGVQAALWVRDLFDDRGLPKEALSDVLSGCRRSSFYWSNGIILIPLANAMGDYAKQYFLYSVYSSLIIGNGAVNTYEELVDFGHRKFWDDDILHRTPSRRRDSFMRSHNINEDMMRLKKKVDPDRHPEWLAGPCIVYLSEYGKDVGNAKTNAGKKIDAEEANAVNDGSVWFQQMGGQLAEAGFNHYFKMVCNEQRVGAISSDRVQVAQSIWAIDVKQIEEKTALRLWWLEPAILQRILDRFTSFDRDFGINREDRTLVGAFVDSVRSFCFKVLKRARDLYCYKEYRLPECQVDAAGNLKTGDPIVFYDIYRVSEADAYDPAFLRGFFERLLIPAKRGLFDQPTFKDLTPTADEFRAQNSYMIDAMEDGK